MYRHGEMRHLCVCIRWLLDFALGEVPTGYENMLETVYGDCVIIPLWKLNPEKFQQCLQVATV